MADTNLLILAREFKKLRTHVQEVLKMPVGPQGLQGETGEQGVKGDTGAPGKDGKDGKDGVNGLNGQDGRNGVDGNDGKDGLDGVGVQNAYIDFDNSLVIVLSNGQEINAGFLSQETKDAVVATFKQGAQTLNELLPVQTGNANKFLKTDGENVSWDTLDGSDIDLASPPVIGSTTPNAATFTTLTATGETSLGGDTTNPSFKANIVSGPTRWLEASGSASGDPVLRSWSTGSAVGMVFQTRGASNFRFTTNASIGNEQFRVSHTASAVNYVQVTGAATGGRVTLSAQGSDTNIGMNLTTKGTGAISLNTGGGEQVRINDSAGATNFVFFNGSSSDVSIGSNGSSATVSILYRVRGAGANHRFFSNDNNNEQFRVAGTASAVNFVQVTGAATGGRVTLSAQGSDTNVGINYNTKGAQNHVFSTNSGNLQFVVANRASTVNWIQAQGNVAGSPPSFTVDGSDTNIDLALTPKGTGLVRFGTRTASADAAITGYIEIKDAGGTVRRLAVIG